MSLISVIIPAYNAAHFLAGAIQSVLTQTLQDFEILIVDDGSTDETAETVRKYLSDVRIHYLYQKNQGLPGARNAGAKASTGLYLAFLDADDFLAENALATMLKTFETTRAAWLNVGVMKIEGEKRSVRHPHCPDGDLLFAILDDDFVTRSPFYPREEFFSIGMYDDQMRNREDWDLNIRMIEAGRPLAIVDQPLYHYRRTEGSITTGNRQRLYLYTERLLRKHHKRLADNTNKEIAAIYARNMWALARSYAYDIHDLRATYRCARESLRYDFDIRRIAHVLRYR